MPIIPPHLRANFAVLLPAFDEVTNIPALFSELRQTFARHGLARIVGE